LQVFLNWFAVSKLEKYSKVLGTLLGEFKSSKAGLVWLEEDI